MAYGMGKARVLPPRARLARSDTSNPRRLNNIVQKRPFRIARRVDNEMGVSGSYVSGKKRPAAKLANFEDRVQNSLRPGHIQLIRGNFASLLA